MSDYGSAYEVGKDYDDKSRAIPYFDNLSSREERAQKRKEYYQLRGELQGQFKVALAKYLGLVGHPKFDRLFDMAWEDGHSEGYYSVAQHADTLAELLRN